MTFGKTMLGRVLLAMLGISVASSLVGATMDVGRPPVEIADMADNTDGVFMTWGSDGIATVFGPGTAGQVPTSNGAGAAPTFQNVNIGDGVRASRGTSQSISNATWTAVAYDGEVYDDNDLHDNVTNNDRLTATVAGRYLVIFQNRWEANATGSRMLRILENGTTERAVYGEPGHAVTWEGRRVVSTIVQLAADEWVTSEVWQDSGGSLNIDANADANPRFLMQRLKDQ